MDNQGYTGFTFNGKHSSEFNIKRTSDGDRYNENLLPTIQDKTVQIPGADGTYFYGSYFTQRVFNVSFAFDSLTEGQLAALKAHFGDKKIHELIFDETPYKKYRAKVTGSTTFKHIPFAEGATNRVYKGEGTLQFTAYDPYAREVYKFLDNYEVPNKELIEALDKIDILGDLAIHEGKDKIKTLKKVFEKLGCYRGSEDGAVNDELKLALRTFNRTFGQDRGDFTSDTKDYLLKALKREEPPTKEWNDAADLLETAGEFDALNIIINGKGSKVSDKNDKVEFPVYNPGVKESPLTIVFCFNTETNKIPSYMIQLGEQFLEFAEITKKSNDATHIWFNSQTELVEGIRIENGMYIKTGDVYNHCITKGNFLKVPLTKNKKPDNAPKVIVTPKFSKEKEEEMIDELNRVTGLRYEYYYL